MDSNTRTNPSATRATGDSGMAPKVYGTTRLGANGSGTDQHRAANAAPGPHAKGGWGSGYDLQEGYAPQGPKADTAATAPPSAPKR